MKSDQPFALLDSPAGAPANDTPAISSDRLLDQAYDEFCQLDEAGHWVASAEFLGRYPTIRSSLGRLIELHREVKDVALREDAIVWPEVGDDFHGFHLERHLGDGASARVFLAREIALGGRRVAVKITRQGDSEAFTLGRIKHPNVIPIHSRTTVPDQELSIICTEYLGSATLCSLLDRVLASPSAPKSAAIIREAARDRFADPADQPAPPRAPALPYEAGVRKFFSEVCAALEYLHGQKILHRDLKPSNILMRPDGSPVLLDFNLARDLKAPAGRFGGTYPYMPPEQLRAMAGAADAPSSAVDERSDLFAVGVLLWETLTGNLPFGPMPQEATSTESIRAFLARQRAGFQAPIPAGWSVSPDLVAIVRRCLSFDPAMRPASAAELRRLLAPVAKPRRRGLWISVGTAAALVGITVAAAAGVVGPGSRLTVQQRYKIGAEAWRVGNTQKAYDEFTHVVTENPSDPRGWWARALVSVKDETADVTRLDKAIYDSQKANERVDPDNKDYAYAGFLLQQLSGADKKNAAEWQYREALKYQQASAAVNNNLAAILCLSPKFDEAIALADQALVDTPNSQPALINRALAENQKALTKTATNKLTDAERNALRKKSLEDLQRALTVGPESGELHFKIASVMLFPTPLEGDPMAHLAKAVDLGFDLKAQQADGALRTVRNDPAFQKLLERQPTNPDQLKMRRLIAPRTELPAWN